MTEKPSEGPESQARCEVCGRERWSGYHPDSSRYCDTRLSGEDGQDSANCYRLGFDRVTAERDTASEALRKAVQDLAAAQAKAEQYERDWYSAKSEFGDAMAKARTRIAAAEAERDRYRGLVLEALYAEGYSSMTTKNEVLPPAKNGHAPSCAIAYDGDCDCWVHRVFPAEGPTRAALAAKEGGE